MSSLDDLFRKPALPSNKRKLEAPGKSYNSSKSPKLHANSDAKSILTATATDEGDDDDLEAGPLLPPDEDGDLGQGDEEGRFFGGGVTGHTADALDFMEGQEDGKGAAEIFDSAWLRKIALNFEKRISKNAELRAKYETKPEKFMASEADLDADIKSLSILSEHPDLYLEFAKLGCVGSLVSLLAHENTDIAIGVMEILDELTDEDVQAEQESWNHLVNAMLEADVLDLITQNFSRLDENEESDRGGVYHALSIMENLASQVAVSEKIAADSTVLKWILQRIEKPESPTTQNKQYAAEILAIILQSSTLNRKRLIELNGVDAILQLLSPYRKRDPEKGTEEEEFAENLFDCIICLVDEVEGKEKLLEAEGIELCLIMLKEGKMSKSRSARLLDHCLGGQSGGPSCEKLVEAAGLKTLFSLFMKKQESRITENLLGILSSLLRSTPANSAARIRTLAKFVEKDYEKIARLVQFRRDYAARSKKSDWDGAGLFCLQTIDTILAWLVAEDDGARERLQDLLADRDESLADIRGTLKEQYDAIDDVEAKDRSVKEMLGSLLQFL